MHENVALMIATIKQDGYAKINHYVFPHLNSTKLLYDRSRLIVVHRRNPLYIYRCVCFYLNFLQHKLQSLITFQFFLYSFFFDIFRVVGALIYYLLWIFAYYNDDHPVRKPRCISAPWRWPWALHSVLAMKN